MSDPSAILNDRMILERLGRGEIFKPGTWEQGNVRGAAYDVRIADDFMIIPDPHFPEGRRYGKGERRRRPVVLEPGAVAFFSTQERLCLPWDICANIGIKFGFARQGILVLTGLLVDPGFGLEKDAAGNWIGKPDERVHFLLANVGSKSVVINPGVDKLVSLQFFSVDEPETKRYVPSGEDMEDEFFEKGAKSTPGLVFFHEVSEAMANLRNVDQKVAALERGTHQLVYFGVFLISASLLAGALAFLVGSLESDTLFSRGRELLAVLPTRWPATVSLLGVGILAVTSLHVTLRFVAGAVSSFLLRRSQ
jgi:deoxycytidine triphosphate deaminase